jgi:NADPH:quinone reductase-like Zn-dependent oxidoreductase
LEAAMKAAVYTKFGAPENIRIEAISKPQPEADQVLVKVIATTVEIADARVRGLRVPGGLKFMTRLAMGPIKPKYSVLGLQFSGIVEAVGSNVKRFEQGDEVVGSTGFRFGCHQEFVVVGENEAIAKKPEGFSHQQAVSELFGGSTAAGYVDSVTLKAGQRILINGASGSVGVAAVCLAKSLGLHVTAVCSGKNAELVQSLGADEVIDYTKLDFRKGSDRFDFIMDNVGNAPFAEVQHLLKSEGKLLVAIFKNLFEMIKNSFNKRAILLTGDDEKKVMSSQMYARLMDMLQTGALKPVIDSEFDLDDIIAAHHRVDTGRKVGAVVVNVGKAWD